LREQEKKAIHEIDEAINEIKKASIDDGKDLTIIPQLTPASIGADVSTVHSNSSTKPTTTSPSRNGAAQGLQQRASTRPTNTSKKPFTSSSNFA
jgi:hypothetical protein